MRGEFDRSWDMWRWGWSRSSQNSANLKCMKMQKYRNKHKEHATIDLGAEFNLVEHDTHFIAGFCFGELPPFPHLNAVPEAFALGVSKPSFLRAPIPIFPSHTTWPVWAGAYAPTYRMNITFSFELNCNNVSVDEVSPLRNSPFASRSSSREMMQNVTAH